MGFILVRLWLSNLSPKIRLVVFASELLVTLSILLFAVLLVRVLCFLGDPPIQSLSCRCLGARYALRHFLLVVWTATLVLYNIIGLYSGQPNDKELRKTDTSVRIFADS